MLGLRVHKLQILMPTSYPETYFPVLVQIVIAVLVASGLVALSYRAGKTREEPGEGFAV